MQLFNRKPGHRSLIKIFSFYNKHVDSELPKYQEAVFKKFGLKINHIVNDDLNHGDFLNWVCRDVTDTDYLIIFDIDCIPTRREWLPLLLADLVHPRTIVGAAQTANHIREARNLYVSPFFFGISTAYLKELNYPDMHLVEGHVDVGQNLTEAILKNGGNIKYWWPTHIEEEKWSLYHPQHTRFGMGTTYNDAVYHAFFSGVNLSARFIVKCQSLLDEAEWPV